MANTNIPTIAMKEMHDKKMEEENTRRQRIKKNRFPCCLLKSFICTPANQPLQFKENAFLFCCRFLFSSEGTVRKNKECTIQLYNCISVYIQNIIRWTCSTINDGYPLPNRCWNVYNLYIHWRLRRWGWTIESFVWNMCDELSLSLSLVPLSRGEDSLITANIWFYLILIDMTMAGL